MCSSVTGKLWFLTDRRIREDYPQKEILRALKAKCCEEELYFRAVVMDEMVLTVEQGNLGKTLQLRTSLTIRTASQSSSVIEDIGALRVLIVSCVKELES